MFNQEKALIGAFSVIVKLRVIFARVRLKLKPAPCTGEGMRLFARHQSDMIYGVSIRRTHNGMDGERRQAGNGEQVATLTLATGGGAGRWKWRREARLLVVKYLLDCVGPMSTALAWLVASEVLQPGGSSIYDIL